MTLEELREACASTCDGLKALAANLYVHDTAELLGKMIRAIPLPAPVVDEFAGHTPGPWVADGNRVDSAECFVAETNHPSLAVRNANTRLLAAAPRLLRERNEARAELARVTKERNQVRDTLLAVRDRLEPLVTAQDEMLRQSARREDKLHSDVATLTKERDDARAELGKISAALDDYGHNGAPWMRDRDGATVIRSMAAKISELAAKVVGLTAALAAQRERDEARAQIQSTFQQWTRTPK